MSTYNRPIYPAFATVTDWCVLSGIGRSTSYEAIGAGHLRTRKVGTRTLIDVAHGLAWLDSLPSADVRPTRARQTA